MPVPTGECEVRRDVRLVGVLSDTHGLVRDSVLEAFKDVDLIIHAGDIGGWEVLEALGEIAPVVAVRGNTDGDWAQMCRLRYRETVELGGAGILVIHDLEKLGDTWRQENCGVVIFGHTHKPSQETIEDVLFLNPGSAGRQSSRHPPSVMLIHVNGQALDPEFVTVD